LAELIERGEDNEPDMRGRAKVRVDEDLEVVHDTRSAAMPAVMKNGELTRTTSRPSYQRSDGDV
jgi:hypothetical protein